MTHKTISLSEKAYNLLKKVKGEGESFSKVIERLISKKENPWLIMQNKFDPEFFDDLKENIRTLREKNQTGSEEND